MMGNGVRMLEGDCLDRLPEIADESVDLLCTDPPYGISFMGKNWDKAVPSVDIWRECLRVLKPGAFGFILSSSRQDCLAQMIVRLGEAGFETGFTSLYWVYATGFPKAQNLWRLVDKMRQGELDGRVADFAAYLKERRKAAGLTKAEVDRRVCNGSTMYGWWEGRGDSYKLYLPDRAHYERLKHVLGLDDRFDDLVSDNKMVVGSEERQGDFGYQKSGERWKGKREAMIANTKEAVSLKGAYAGFQPKPAVEPVLVVMKPLEQKTYLDQALDNGKGCTWLDDGRIPTDWKTDPTRRGWQGRNLSHDGGSVRFVDKDKHLSQPNIDGRFPANVLVEDDALGSVHTKSAGSRKSFGRGNPGSGDSQGVFGSIGRGGYGGGRIGDGPGSFSRYFDLDAWHAKAMEGLPERMRQTFPFLPVPKPSKREKNQGVGNNKHPTVKPQKLMNYLITIGTRKGDVVLDPFAGSGTTGMAAICMGRQFIGIEIDPNHVELARRRIAAFYGEMFSDEAYEDLVEDDGDQ